MGIYRFIGGLFKREKDASTDAEPRRGSTAALWLNDSNTELSIATVFSCVKLLSDSVASLPVVHAVKRGDIFTPTASRLSYLLNVEPDPSMSGYDMWSQAMINVLLDGNAYIVPMYNGRECYRLALCSRGTVYHDTVTNTYTVADPEVGICGVYSEADVIHIKGMPGRNPKRGVSVLTHARLNMEIAKSGDRETAKRFKSGGNVRGILTNSKATRGMGVYEDGELKKAAIDINDAFNEEGVGVVSVPDEADFKQLSLSSADMEFLQTRKFSVLELCRFFRVPPSFVFADTAGNYKSVEQASMAFLNQTLNPLLKNIETELNRKLLAEELYRYERIEFDRRGIQACDLASRADYESRLLGMGWTINELRRLNNMAPVENGDTPMCSANLRRLDEYASGNRE